MVPVYLNCLNCGIAFRRPPSQGHLKYCSGLCWYAFAKGKGLTGANLRIEAPCQMCGKRTLIAQSRKTTFKWCSRKCQALSKTGRPSKRKKDRVELHYIICGTVFHKLQCQIDSGRGRTCSTTCRAHYSLSVQKRSRTSPIELKFLAECVAAGADLMLQQKRGPFTIDAVTADGLTAIEFDGTYWHSLPRVAAADAKKDRYLTSLGMRIIRIPEALYKTDPSAAIFMVTQLTAP